MKFIICILAVVVWVGLMCSNGWTDDRFASRVADYSNLGASPYDDPNSALGRPSLWMKGAPGPGNSDGIFACSMICGAWNTDPNGNKLITTVKAGGYLTVEFDKPILDDPANWFGKDFIVFGNSAFSGAGGYISVDTDMGAYRILNGTSGTWEPGTVSVSQDGVTWYTFTSGPFVDDFAPTQAFTWDRDTRCWDIELDPTKPVNPSLTKASFAGKTVADAIDLYNGSAGGAAFDISGLPLAVDANGRKWIRFVRINGGTPAPEVDAVARVSNVPPIATIADAKRQAEMTGVRIEGVITAGSSELGNCFYIESEDRSCGVMVTGRSAERGRKVIVGGVMSALNGEKRVKAISLDDDGEGSAAPLGMSGRTMSGCKIAVGLLVRTWGKVGDVDEAGMTFTVDDGSGCKVTCIAPNDPWFTLPGNGDFISVTGVCSGGPVLRIRAQDDIN